MNTEHCYKMKISVHNKASLNVFLNTYELNVKKKLWGGGVRAKELVNKYRVELRQKVKPPFCTFFMLQVYFAHLCNIYPFGPWNIFLF